MILAKHIITVYSRYLGNATPPIPPSESWQKTVIKYAQWEDRTDRNFSSQGLNTIDRHISIIIPTTANMQCRKYITWQEFEKTALTDKTPFWTLKPDSSIICYGETPDVTSSMTISTIRSSYRSCLCVGVEDFSLQKIIPHWEITGV